MEIPPISGKKRRNQESESQQASKDWGLSLHELLVDEPPSVEVTTPRQSSRIQSQIPLIPYGAAWWWSWLTLSKCVLDAQPADKALWASMADLMNDQGWTLDECLCEFTNVRSDLATLLQPRPKISKPPPVPPIVRPTGKGSKGYGKSKGKSSKYESPSFSRMATGNKFAWNINPTIVAWIIAGLPMFAQSHVQTTQRVQENIQHSITNRRDTD